MKCLMYTNPFDLFEDRIVMDCENNDFNLYENICKDVLECDFKPHVTRIIKSLLGSEEAFNDLLEYMKYRVKRYGDNQAAITFIKNRRYVIEQLYNLDIYNKESDVLQDEWVIKKWIKMASDNEAKCTRILLASFMTYPEEFDVGDLTREKILRESKKNINLFLEMLGEKKTKQIKPLIALHGSNCLDIYMNIRGLFDRGESRNRYIDFVEDLEEFKKIIESK